MAGSGASCCQSLEQVWVSTLSQVLAQTWQTGTDKKGHSSSMSRKYLHREKRETLHLFQPLRADQMPDPHQGQDFPPTSQCSIGNPIQMVY